MHMAYDAIVAVSFSWEWAARNYALVSIVLTAVVLTVLPALIVVKYVRLILPLLKDTKPPLSMGLKGHRAVAGEEVEFRAFDGVALRGHILTGRHDDRPAGMVVFAHEYDDDRHSCIRYCRSLLDAGYDVFTFDFRGHGDSSHQEGYQPRQWVSDRELADLEGALAFIADWLEQRSRKPEVAMFGVSRGAAAAVIAAVNHAQVRAVLCDGVFSSDKLLEHLMKRWASIFARIRFVYEHHHPAFWRFLRWCVFRAAQWQLKCSFPSVRKALMRMPPRPVLFIHGEKDSHVPVDHVRALYAVASQPKELWIVPGARHNQAAVVTPEAYAAHTVAFLDQHLAGTIPLPDELPIESIVAGASRPFRVSPTGAILTAPPAPGRRGSGQAETHENRILQEE